MSMKAIELRADMEKKEISSKKRDQKHNYK